MSIRDRGGDLLDKLSFGGIPERIKTEELPLIKINIDEEIYEGLTLEDRDFLNKKAQEIAGRMVRSIQDQISIAESLAEAQNRFSSHRNGSFVKWYESIGLKKDYVYTLINKVKIYEKFGRQIENRILRDSEIEINEGVQEKVFKLPEKAVRIVSSYSLKERKEKLDSGDVIEIIAAPSPVKRASEIIKTKFSSVETDVEKVVTRVDALDSILKILTDEKIESVEDPRQLLRDIREMIMRTKRG